ncbi:PAS domain S-box protein [Legionella cardiaca]|uniref:PAS domain S-box protein n=1 Tax=Legionella cardiaca TaxID=1071983 RepID=A0ABY8ARJ6_9GAMM|nr:PAS domain S-box protein [Legionella cardiaca]WED43290.1 PAS domain S-box protein [Legionella cardiaca]
MSLVEKYKRKKNYPVVIANQWGIIIYVNQKFEEVFKWMSAEIIGESLTTIIPPTLHDAHNLGFSRFLATGQSSILDKTIQLKAIDKDGIVFKAEHCIQAEKNEEGVWTFMATIRPLKA